VLVVVEADGKDAWRTRDRSVEGDGREWEAWNLGQPGIDFIESGVAGFDNAEDRWIAESREINDLFPAGVADEYSRSGNAEAKSSGGHRRAWSKRLLVRGLKLSGEGH
jgi:hypothetical protein